MESMGVITRIDEPPEWCAGMVVVPKRGGKVRICVDLTKLNESVCRERHILPSVEQTLEEPSTLPSSMQTRAIGRLNWIPNQPNSRRSLRLLGGSVLIGCHLASHPPQNIFNGE